MYWKLRWLGAHQPMEVNRRAAIIRKLEETFFCGREALHPLIFVFSNFGVPQGNPSNLCPHGH